MARYGVTLNSPSQIAKAQAWFARAAQLGWRVVFAEPKRSDDQNNRLWEMLARVEKRMDIGGRKFPADDWKCIFMKAMGKDVQFLPTLDGNEFFPTGFRSSDLSVREMCDLQTFMEAWAAEHGVTFRAQVAA